MRTKKGFKGGGQKSISRRRIGWTSGRPLRTILTIPSSVAGGRLRPFLCLPARRANSYFCHSHAPHRNICHFRDNGRRDYESHTHARAHIIDRGRWRQRNKLDAVCWRRPASVRSPLAASDVELPESWETIIAAKPTRPACHFLSLSQLRLYVQLP